MKIIHILFFIITFLFATNLKSDEVLAKGKQIFLNIGNCAACHSLKDA